MDQGQKGEQKANELTIESLVIQRPLLYKPFNLSTLRSLVCNNKISQSLMCNIPSFQPSLNVHALLFIATQ